MPSPHQFFTQSSFPGSSGTALTAITPTYSEGLSSPYYTVFAGTITTDGGGNLVGTAGSIATSNAVIPADGNLDVSTTYSLTSSNQVIHLVRTTSSHNLEVAWNAGGTITVLDIQSSAVTIGTVTGVNLTGSSVTLLSRYRVSGSDTLITLFVNGAQVGTTYMATQTTVGGLGAGWIDSQGGASLASFYLADAAASTGVPSGPSTCNVGVPSGAFTITLNEPAGSGGQVVNLATTGGSDLFQATSGGSTVTSITIASGSTTGTFYYKGGAAGTQTITPTSSGITFAPLTLSITVNATSATTYTALASPTSIAPGSTTTASVTPNGNYTGTITGTPTGTASTGLSPVVLTFTASSTPQPASFTPTVAGTLTITWTNSGSLTNPANDTITVAAQTLALSGAGSDAVGSAYVATVTPSASATGTVTITPSGSASTGLSPVVLTFTASSTPQPASFTPTVVGTLILTETTTTGLTIAGSPLSVTVTASVTTTFQSWATGFASGLASSMTCQPYVNGVSFGSIITGATAGASGEYFTTFTASLGAFVNARWTDPSGNASTDTTPIPLPQILATATSLASLAALVGSNALPTGLVVSGSTTSAVIVSGQPSSRNYGGQRLVHYPSGEARTIAYQSYASPNYTFTFNGTLGTEAGPFSALTAGDNVSPCP